MIFIHYWNHFILFGLLDYVIELCPNGELLGFIKKFKSFDEESTRFYTAEIVNALEHLHMKGIVHRDLKPENVLLSKEMHAKLTDFGTAKDLKKEAEDAAKQIRKKLYIINHTLHIQFQFNFKYI